jgi:hypothetical protein
MDDRLRERRPRVGRLHADAAVSGIPTSRCLQDLLRLAGRHLFLRGAYSEAKLIRLAYAFEQATKARRAPQFLATARAHVSHDDSRPLSLRQHRLRPRLGGRPVEDARACVRCTFCTKHGGVWTSHPESRLAVKVADEALVSRYEFGTRTATFHVCARCGVPAFVTSDIDGRAMRW